MFVALLIIILCFGLVVFMGAPYVPTLTKQQTDALDLLALHKGQTVLDIGSGDGRLLYAAAKRGIQGVGIEVNPLLVVVSWLVTLRYRRYIRIVWGNMWHVRWPDADGIYVFLHTRYMQKLDSKIQERYSGKRIPVVSYAFTIPNKKPRTSKNGLYKYIYS